MGRRAKKAPVCRGCSCWVFCVYDSIRTRRSRPASRAAACSLGFLGFNYVVVDSGRPVHAVTAPHIDVPVASLLFFAHDVLIVRSLSSSGGFKKHSSCSLLLSDDLFYAQVVTKKRPKLAKRFKCPFCANEDVVECKMVRNVRSNVGRGVR